MSDWILVVTIGAWLTWSVFGTIVTIDTLTSHKEPGYRLSRTILIGGPLVWVVAAVMFFVMLLIGLIRPKG